MAGYHRGVGTDALPSTSGIRHVIVWLLGVGYGLILAFVVLWPSPVDQPVAGLLQRVIRELHERGVPSFIDYEFIEFAGNIALFVPVGLFFGLAVPMRLWALAFMLGPAVSACVEVVQRVVLSERYASVADVIANSLGATIGVMCALALRAAVAQRDDAVIARHEARAARAT